MNKENRKDKTEPVPAIDCSAPAASQATRQMVNKKMVAGVKRPEQSLKQLSVSLDALIRVLHEKSRTDDEQEIRAIEREIESELNAGKLNAGSTLHGEALTIFEEDVQPFDVKHYKEQLAEIKAANKIVIHRSDTNLVLH